MGNTSDRDRPEYCASNRAKFHIAGIYRGADKSLARPGRKQATVTEDFDVHISYLLSKLEEY